MKFARNVVAALALSALAGSAIAADMPARTAPMTVAPVPAPSWTGFYLGVNAGYAWSAKNGVGVFTAPVYDFAIGGYGLTSAAMGTFGAAAKSDGFIGGGQIGYNYQIGALVAGVEADAQWFAGGKSTATQFGSAFNALILGGSTGTQIATVDKSIDYLATLRGRLGFAVTPSLLAYATGGLALGGVKGVTSIAQFYPPAGGASNIIATGEYSGPRVGWTLGAGAEYLISPNWSAKVEYLYYDLGSVSYDVGALTSYIIGSTTVAFAGLTRSQASYAGHVVRAGVNYRFGGSAAPVVARY